METPLRPAAALALVLGIAMYFGAMALSVSVMLSWLCARLVIPHIALH